MNEKNQQVIQEVAVEQLTGRRVDHAGKQWWLYATHPGGEPTIKDLDWAERLGFERPRNIRNLIKRMASGGLLGVVVCSTVKQTPGSVGGRTAVEYFLTKAQALKVAAKSDTPMADELLDQMIQVFLIAAGHATAQEPVAVDRWSAGDGDALDLVEQLVKSMKAERRRVSELAAQQSAMIADQAELAKTQALQAVAADETRAKVDQILVAQQAAEIELRAPQSPVMTLPELDRKFDTLRIIRAYGKATGDYRGGFNAVYGLYRDLFHIDLKARAKNRKVKPALIAEEIGAWDALHAIAVKYLCPKTDAALAAKGRAYHA